MKNPVSCQVSIFFIFLVMIYFPAFVTIQAAICPVSYQVPIFLHSWSWFTFLPLSQYRQQYVCFLCTGHLHHNLQLVAAGAAPKAWVVPNTFCLAFSSLGLAPNPNTPPPLLPPKRPPKPPLPLLDSVVVVVACPNPLLTHSWQWWQWHDWIFIINFIKGHTNLSHTSVYSYGYMRGS